METLLYQLNSDLRFDHDFVIFKDIFKYTADKEFIFLDIDGVLNCNRDGKLLANMTESDFLKEDSPFIFVRHPGKGWDFASKEKLLLLQKLVERRPNLMFINISSVFNSTDDIKEAQQTLSLPYFANSFSTCGGYQRCSGIEEFVRNFKIKTYCVIDDQSPEYYESIHSNQRLVHISNGIGLTEKDIASVEDILNLGVDIL